jgi:2-polyprenyl-3-methyl-5-hydroxy-6-metoxy-1,4-benzoquinol methylase
MKNSVKENNRDIEVASFVRKEWLGKEIKPISLMEVRGIMKQLYTEVLGFDRYAYTTTRGVRNLLDEDSYDYARLPPSDSGTALQVIKSLKPDDEWLDLGCGSGTFIAEVLKDINPKIRAVGFDARRWGKEDQADIPELVLGDVDTMDTSSFPNHPNGFDLITSASVFYHLPDYWGVLEKAVNLLKPNGEISISTIVRPMKSGIEPINDEKGEFTEDPDDCGALYYRNRNIFDSDGRFMSIAEAVRIINTQNPGFKLEYHSGANKGVSTGELAYGGGFSGKKLDTKPIDLSFVFYCYYPEKRGNVIGLTDISFIFARTQREAYKLRGEGFVSVQDRR